MIERVAAYLAEKKEPASSQELAQQVLRMVNTPPALADRLIAGVISDDPQFRQDEQGLWHFCPKQTIVPLWQQPFFLISTRPERVAHWSMYQRIALATWDQGHMEICAVLVDHFFAGLTGYGEEIKSRAVIVPGWGNQLSHAGELLRSVGVIRPGLLTSLRDLAALAFPDDSIENSDQLAQQLGLPAYGETDAVLDLQQLTDQLAILLQRLQQQGVQHLAQVQERLQRDRPAVVFDRFVYDDQFIRTLPTSAGVYVMYDRNDQPIYIGKAKNLQERVSCYFQSTAQVDEKLAEIRRQLADVRILPTGSELEARLLEYKLILQWDPPINRQLQVKDRPHRQKNRFPRIVIFSAAASAHASLFFIHPEKPLLSVALLRSQEATPSAVFERVLPLADHETLATVINDYFFVPAAAALPADPYREIAVSWLSEYETDVESIDMRQVAHAGDAVRLITAYLQSDRVAEPRIFY